MKSQNLYKKLSQNNLNEFRILVRKALGLSKQEDYLFYSIPENNWAKLFQNFNSDLAYAKRVIMGEKDDVQHKEKKYLERVKRNIDNFKITSETLNQYIHENKKVIFITDFDNDGSLSQAILFQFLKVLPEDKKDNVKIEYAREVEGNSNRGFTFELTKKLAEINGLDEKSDFLIVTADNGINSRSEQLKINEYFPNAILIITDHHNPEEDMYIQENEKTIIFNPHYDALKLTSPEVIKARNIKDTKERKESRNFFSKYNISGASTVGVLVKEYIRINELNLNELDYMAQLELGEELNNSYELMLIDRLSRMSNMLDYVETHPADKPLNPIEIDNYLDLQSLLNINNSLNKLILNRLSDKLIDDLKKINEKATDENKLDIDVITSSNEKLFALNRVSQALLSQYKRYLSLDDIAKQKINDSTLESNFVHNAIIKLIEGDEVYNVQFQSDNKNYIEQLRPHIFDLTVDDNKSKYENLLLDSMIDVYNKMKIIEKAIIKELRKTEILDVYELSNSTIMVLNNEFQRFFNRKLLNKTYNGSNNGFSMILDSIKDNRISGSFRSLFDIKDILEKEKIKNELEKKLNITIQTPGHERAAGFIIESKDGSKLDKNIIEEINNVINNSITALKINQENNSDLELITDLDSIETIDRINQIVLGNVAHFSRITPVIELDENIIYTNPKTGEQTSLQDLVDTNKYGYVIIQTKLPSGSSTPQAFIAPTGLIRKIVDSKVDKSIEGAYPLALKLNYMNKGVFIGEAAIETDKIEHIVKLEKNVEIKEELEKVFKEHREELAKGIPLTLEEIKDSPFVKYNKFGQDDFDKFMQVIIRIIDKSKVDYFSVFDVEATGFGMSNLINIGFMNYMIDEDDVKYTKKINADEFNAKLFKTIIGKDYLVNFEDLIKNNIIKKLDEDEYKNAKENNKSFLAQDMFGNDYFINDYKELEKQSEEVKNHITNDKEVIYNRVLKGETLAFLVKPIGYSIEAYITKLTGITNEMADKYGYNLKEVDDFIVKYFGDKRTMFMAHNTEYDARISRANLLNFSRLLSSQSNLIMDSAEYSKNLHLMYDNIEIMSFQNIPALNGYYFYNDEFSTKLSLSKFIHSNEEGEFPDVKNKMRIIKTRSPLTNEFEFYAQYKKTNVLEKIEITRTTINISDNDEMPIFKTIKVTLSDLLNNVDDAEAIREKLAVISAKGMKHTDIGYKAQGLAEQKFIRQMLLSKTDFKVNLIEDFSEYQFLVNHKDKLIDFQNKYRFNKTLKQNTEDFLRFYNEDLILPDLNKFNTEFKEFGYKFLNLNSDISKLYNDTWVYKTVLLNGEPNLYSDLNQTNYEIISSDTGVPTDIVKEIMEEAYQFKRDNKEIGCTKILHHESHMNGPFKGDVVGDVVYEDKATIMLLNDRLSNNYKDDIETVANYFLSVQKEYQIKFLKQLNTVELTAIDSMSYKQHRGYVNRGVETDAINTLAKIDSELSQDYSKIRFKLSEAELQANKQVLAVLHPNIEITPTIIDEDAKKIAYVLACLQMSDNGFDIIKESNADELLDVKKDLLNRYLYLEVNTGTQLITDYIKCMNDYLQDKIDIAELLTNNAISEPQRKNGVSGKDVLSTNHFDSIENILIHQIFAEISFLDYPLIKDDIIKLSKEYEEGEFSFKYNNNFINYIAEFLDETREIKYEYTDDNIQLIYATNEIDKMPVEESIEDTKYSLRNAGIENEYLNKVLICLYINSLAYANLRNTPNRVDKLIDSIKNGESVQYDSESVTDDNFLSDKHSSIKRLKVSQHLIQKLNYIDLSYKAIIANEHSPELIAANKDDVKNTEFEVKEKAKPKPKAKTSKSKEKDSEDKDDSKVTVDTDNNDTETSPKEKAKSKTENVEKSDSELEDKPKPKTTRKKKVVEESDDIKVEDSKVKEVDVETQKVESSNQKSETKNDIEKEVIVNNDEDLDKPKEKRTRARTQSSKRNP